MQHRANRNVRGRHRRAASPHSHRAPGTPLGEKGRYVVAAALVAGVGVGGVTVATSGASSAPAAKARPAAAQATLAAPAPSHTAPSGPDSSDTAPTGPGTSDTAPSSLASPAAVAPASALPQRLAGPADDGPASVPQVRKIRPLPLWVNPLPEGTTTSCFGPRWGRLHAGIDLAAPDGTRIRAAGAGIVVAAGPAEGYGIAVLIDHENGYLTHYGHLSAITVTPGQHVTAGDQIGNEGSTGHSTGPHLHFEVHQGAYQNPIEPTAWMREHGVDIAGCAAPTS